jgi:hypothetical protein
VFNHLYTSNDPAELVQTNEELSRYQTKNKAYQRLLLHRNYLIKVADANTTLTAKAQTLNLATIKVIGDGNCLQYAINTAHKEQTNFYLANNDDLRLLATALAREFTRQQNGTPREIINQELKAIDLTAKNGHYHYPGTYMYALASIRHGPIIVIDDTPGTESVTFSPLHKMTEILFRPHHGTNPIPQAPYLPPIYILNRTTVDPPHYDATKLAEIPLTNPLIPPPDPEIQLRQQPDMPPPPPKLQRHLHPLELGLDCDPIHRPP